MNPKESYDMAFDQGRRAGLPDSSFRLARKNREDCPYIEGQHAIEIDGAFLKTQPVWFKGWTAGWDSVVGGSRD